jgi:hypothetical protein
MNTDPLPLPEPTGPAEDSLFGEMIFAYTRAQALEDGVLVDVTETAREVGFKLPTAITGALENRLTPTHADRQVGQSYEGRLWDVLWVAAFAIRLNRETDTVGFTISQQETDARTGEVRQTDLRLWAVCGPGDQGEAVITIGFPEDF